MRQHPLASEVSQQLARLAWADRQSDSPARAAVIASARARLAELGAEPIPSKDTLDTLISEGQYRQT